MKKIYIGSIGNSSKDLKNAIKDHLNNYNIEEITNDNVGKNVATTVLNDSNSVGIIMCGNGFGISKDASIHDDITVINCVNKEQVISGREVNDANILALGARLVSIKDALELVDTFLNT